MAVKKRVPSVDNAKTADVPPFGITAMTVPGVLLVSLYKRMVVPGVPAAEVDGPPSVVNKPYKLEQVGAVLLRVTGVVLVAHWSTVPVQVEGLGKGSGSPPPPTLALLVMVPSAATGTLTGTLRATLAPALKTLLVVQVTRVLAVVQAHPAAAAKLAFTGVIPAGKRS